ncbi:BT_3928 family protein [Thermonema rossianum]|uniref:BT_3928 family protein n=1 Tax=Thermonema rossianum TaxID=55505 RepID=UPI000570DC70|nr:BT_3928 family protein [Thermonema rossianum]
MKNIDRLAIILVGGLFIFSGLIKLNDPVGTQIKLEEYFEVFAQDVRPHTGNENWASHFFEALIPYALFFSVLLSSLEVVLGVMLLSGYRRRQAIGALLAMIVFFTFLTFYSWHFNKVTDCGCFGDAIKLTPKESFIKDVVLLLLIAYLFLRRKQLGSSTAKRGLVITLTAAALSVGLAWYAIAYLPPLDFRPYRVGNHIPSLMKPSAAFQYEYIMEKEGKQYVFQEYPTDTTYTFVDMKLLNPEALPKITDFRAYQGDTDITDSLFQGTCFLVVIHDVNDNEKLLQRLSKAKPVIEELINSGVKVSVLSAASPDALEVLLAQAGWHHVVVASIDHTVAKTMVRSNPGYLLLQDGYVRGKWSYRALPASLRYILNQ